MGCKKGFYALNNGLLGLLDSDFRLSSSALGQRNRFAGEASVVEGLAHGDGGSPVCKAAGGTATCADRWQSHVRAIASTNTGVDVLVWNV